MRLPTMSPHDPRNARAAERWFLQRGLPAVLRPGTLVRRVWPRSAPALAAFAVMMAFSIVVVIVTGKHTIDIDGSRLAPSGSSWRPLVLVLPVAATVGWLVSRIRSVRASALAAFGVGGRGGHWRHPRRPEPAVPRQSRGRGHRHRGVLALHRNAESGSMLGWGVRTDAGQPRVDGRAVLRALPVVLLTVLVFFNGLVWLMASIVSRARLWLALLFLVPHRGRLPGVQHPGPGPADAVGIASHAEDDDDA